MLSEAHLPKPPLSSEIYPKGPHSDQLLAKKVFRGGVKLYVHRKDESEITEAHLAAGAAPDKMSKSECELWLRAISAGDFSVRVKLEDQEEQDEPEQEEEKDEEEQGENEDEDDDENDDEVP